MEQMILTLSNSEEIVLIDQEDFERVKKYGWYLAKSGRGDPHIRARDIERDYNKKVLLHRVIMDCPSGMVVDHINKNTFDNRKCNLRICTNAQNMRNKKKKANSLCFYKGVYFQKSHGKWVTRVSLDKKMVYRGYFSDPRTAFIAYIVHAKKHHGEFASFK